MDKLLVHWSDALCVGHKTIDGQHQKLVGLLNELYAAAIELRGQKAILESLTAMGAYTQEHFTDEERMMETCGYDDAKRHKAEHLAFIDYVTQALKRLELNDFISSVELIKYLRDWLTNHILTVDKHYADVLNAAGGSCEGR